MTRMHVPPRRQRHTSSITYFTAIITLFVTAARETALTLGLPRRKSNAYAMLMSELLQPSSFITWGTGSCLAMGDAYTEASAGTVIAHDEHSLTPLQHSFTTICVTVTSPLTKFWIPKHERLSSNIVIIPQKVAGFSLGIHSTLV